MASSRVLAIVMDAYAERLLAMYGDHDAVAITCAALALHP